MKVSFIVVFGIQKMSSLFYQIHTDLMRSIVGEYKNNADGFKHSKIVSIDDAMYHATQGSAKELDLSQLPNLIRQNVSTFLEIGSFLGVSFRFIYETFRPNISFSIDPNIPHRTFHNPRSVFKKLNRNHLNNIMLIDGYWHEESFVAKVKHKESQIIKPDYFRNVLFDLILIDADHTYEALSGQFFEALKILSPDGCILIHDVYSWEPVREFVKELDNDNRFVLEYTSTKGIDGFCSVKRRQE